MNFAARRRKNETIEISSIIQSIFQQIEEIVSDGKKVIEVVIGLVVTVCYY